MKNNFNNNKVLTLFRNHKGIFFKYNVLSVALSNLWCVLWPDLNESH